MLLWSGKWVRGTVLGDQDEKIYVEMSHRKLATLGIDPLAMFNVLRQQNNLVPAGKAHSSTEWFKGTGAEIWQGRTGPHGCAEVHLAPGSYQVEAFAFGHRSKRVEIDFPEKTNDVCLEIPIGFSLTLRSVGGDTQWRDRIDSKEGSAIQACLTWKRNLVNSHDLPSTLRTTIGAVLAIDDPTGPRVTTVAFVTLGLAEVLHLGNARSRDQVLGPTRAMANPYAVGAVVLTVLVQCGVMFVPGAQRLLHLEVLRHRIIPNFNAEADGISSLDIIAKLLETTPSVDGKHA
jgi:hypothetical protein